MISINSFIILLLTLITSVKSNTILETTSGTLNGYENGEIETYLGVPYAKAPIGNLRFAKPQQLDDKSQYDVRDATKYSPACVQFNHADSTINPLLLSSRQNRQVS